MVSVAQDAGAACWEVDLTAAVGASGVLADVGVVQVQPLALLGICMLRVAVLDRCVGATRWVVFFD